MGAGSGRHGLVLLAPTDVSICEVPMAIVKKTGGTGGTPAHAPPTPKTPLKKGASVTPSYSLSTDKSAPSDDILDYSWLLYGEKKIGKTTLSSRFPEAISFMFEPGAKGVRIAARACPDWKTFLGYVATLKATDVARTVVIDTADRAYEKCFAHVCKREGFEHPTDENDFGKSWGKIKNEFIDTLESITATGRTIVFISHAEENEFQERTGVKYKKIIPSMSKQAREFLRGFVDIIGYYGYYGQERLLTIEGSDALDAGHRIEEHFWTPGGERVHSIPMGSSADEGWENILTAFDNRQVETHEPKRQAALSEIPVPFGKKK